ncbi:MAG: hypothetical protein ACJLS3_14885 [Erythrobacter sp.]
MRITATLTAGAIGLTLAGTALAAPEGKRARLDPAASVTRADTLAMANQRFRPDRYQQGWHDQCRRNGRASEHNAGAPRPADGRTRRRPR